VTYAQRIAVLILYIRDPRHARPVQLLGTQCNNWPAFKQAFISLFRRPEQLLLNEQSLDNLHQGPTESVDQFFRRTTSLLEKVGLNHQDEMLVKAYVRRGLRPDLRKEFYRNRTAPLAVLVEDLLCEELANHHSVPPPLPGPIVQARREVPRPSSSTRAEPPRHRFQGGQRGRDRFSGPRYRCFYCDRPGHRQAEIGRAHV
jgi:hypothetical protein